VGVGGGVWVGGGGGGGGGGRNCSTWKRKRECTIYSKPHVGVVLCVATLMRTAIPTNSITCDTHGMH